MAGRKRRLRVTGMAAGGRQATACSTSLFNIVVAVCNCSAFGPCAGVGGCR
jgi:hypothetical protein